MPRAALLLLLALQASAAMPGPRLLERFELKPQEIPAPSIGELDSRPGPAAGPLLTAALWNRLPVPTAEALSAASSRLPWLQGASVREVTAAEARTLFGAAADRGYGLLDLFTDPGFSGNEVYLLSAPTLAALAGEFEVPTACSVSGSDVHGRAFVMRMIVAGRGHVDMLYDRDFEFKNPAFPDYPFLVRSTIRQTIDGPGTLSVQGLSVDAGLFKPEIRRFVRLSADKIRVETSMGAREAGAMPIKRKEQK